MISAQSWLFARRRTSVSDVRLQLGAERTPNSYVPTGLLIILYAGTRSTITRD